MTTAQPQKLTLQAKLVLVVACALVLSGFFFYDVTRETLERGWRDLFGRRGGPMTIRFVLQPMMAFLSALHDGIRDARTGRSPYLRTVLFNRTERMGRLSEGLVSTARLILIGIAVDAIYQLRVLGTFYPIEALLIALALAFVPYLLLRGPIARIARPWLTRASEGSS